MSWFKKEKTEEPIFEHLAMPVSFGITGGGQQQSLTAVMDPPKVEEAVTPVKPSFMRVECPNPNPEYKSFAEECANILGYSTLQYKISKPLAEVLVKLDIEILDTEEVELYKKQTQKITQDNWDNQNVDINWHFHTYFSWVCSPLNKGDYIPQKGSPAYHGEIPEFVLNKALQIKREMPSVTFHIWHMVSYQDPFLSVSLGEYPHNEMYYIEVWDEPKFEGRITK